MRATIAIASGKGGTGKTTVAVNLAAVAGGPVTLADCDVEAPNAHLFLRPQWRSEEPFAVPLPHVDPVRCTGCGACRDVCRYGAVILLGGRPMFFPELCHGCGGCSRACPERAIAERRHPCGRIRVGDAGRVRFVDGELDIGQVKSPSLIRAVRRRAAEAGGGGGPVLIDAPPGTACPVVAAVRGADYLVLVTEPTPFGLHDLTLAVELARQLGLPLGVVLNRAGLGSDQTSAYCRAEGIELLARINYDPRIARAYAAGGLLVEQVPEHRGLFERLWADVLARTGAGEAA